MRIDLKKDVLSLTDFARNTKEHTKELNEGGGARILTQNGKAAVVVLSLEAYEKMAAAAEEHQMDLRLHAAVKSYAEGNLGQPSKTVFSRIRKQSDKRRASR